MGRRNMSIKINSFGGPLVWLIRKYHSDFSSKIMLTVTEFARRKQISGYIDWFYSQPTTPDFKFLMLETINRCNGKCSFCPASVDAEKRAFKRMEDAMIHKIFSELSETGWSGDVFLNVNNEPFIDTRILRIARQFHELELGGVRIITNGTLLAVEKLQEIAEVADELIINDYSEQYRLTENIKQIYEYVKRNKQLFKNINIVINRRYSKEVLATRAGNAPNKPRKNNKISGPCIYPFTDLVIFPDGKVGMCCNDCMEITDMGNVNEESLMAIWRGKKLTEVREAVRKSRLNYSFCRECDVMDAGSREKKIASKH